MRHARMTAAMLALCLAPFAAPGRAWAIEVVTDMPVVHSLTSMVMGEIGQPKILLEEGADPHDFQLRPSQVSALQGADVVIWIGPEMTPWLERALAATQEPNTLALLHQKGTVVRVPGDEEPGGRAEDAEEPAGHEDDILPRHGADHDHGDLDPHAWLDPDNAELWIGLISDALVERDPGNAVAYRANASLALMRLETVNGAIAKRLEDHADAGIVVAHDAYGYFADHFGLTISGALAAGDGADPGAAHRVRLRALLESGDAVCAFPEAGRDSTPITTLAEGTPARIGEPLDPEGRMMTPGPDLYPALLTRMAETIIACLDGA